ncbi:pigment-dispersing hormone 2 peptides-like [Portunus trituberculatus]|uniref:pigment-dispersing hormone 2 peptides-like n=1 Tax=Portunus trituberculatus TaxID=210409 RepID=UPI001E1CD9E6|nr:pigment-dispersing hormone 2 peptides-like [Portunus trituberculatus]XP_045114191.1 pigment-dispersing hormone 2 peptides-like [Portunus trituberculatus]XP_045114192.1 pigment-dispersing hormone 2 peptides-like [Portunus trituberculatus]
MRSGVFMAVLVLVVLAALLTQGQQLHVPEREAVATLAARILKVVHAQQDAAAGLPHKRNSELINSLLGISALMNEAGRR